MEQLPGWNNYLGSILRLGWNNYLDGTTTWVRTCVLRPLGHSLYQLSYVEHLLRTKSHYKAGKLSADCAHCGESTGMPLASRDRPHKDPHPSQGSHFFSPARRALRLSSSSGPSRPPRGQPRPVPVARVPPRTRPTPPARQLPLWGASPPPAGRARRLLAALRPHAREAAEGRPTRH